MLNPDSIYDKLVTLGQDWACKNAAADVLEESRKSILSQAMLDSDEKSVSAKEMNAYCHDKYIEFIKEMVTARKTANIAKVNYDSAKVWAELKRTEAANERAANRSAT